MEYAFLFPLGIAVAAAAMTAGISGSAFWIPIYLLWLGLEPQVAFWLSLLTMLFGFGSGVVRNLRAGTVSSYLVVRYLAVAGPATALGAVVSTRVRTRWLLLVFAAFVVTYGLKLVLDALRRNGGVAVAHDRVYYTVGVLAGLVHGGIATGGGVLLLPALLHHRRVGHHSEAVGSTVVLVFVMSILAVVFRLDSYLMTCQGECVSKVASMLLFAAPGVVIGGQLGPRLSRRMPRRILRPYIGVLLVLVGVLVGLRGFAN